MKIYYSCVAVVIAALMMPAAMAKNDKQNDQKSDKYSEKYTNKQKDNDKKKDKERDDRYGRDNNNNKSLPPGLQKKVAEGKPLPPGWQKKLAKGDILSRDIFSRGEIVSPRDRDGRVSVNVDGTVIRVMENTREIIDILKR
jgi:Ni/Co efflux regulator RcnB